MPIFSHLHRPPLQWIILNSTTSGRLTFGNLSRGSVIGASLFNGDTALLKKFSINEKWNFQFRAEAFNVLNHANFNTPNAIVFFGNSISPSAGIITDTATRERQIQFAVRILF